MIGEPFSVAECVILNIVYILDLLGRDCIHISGFADNPNYQEKYSTTFVRLDSV